MAGSAEILQEYLVSLGFKTDAISFKKFDDNLGAIGKRVLTVGGAVAGVVASMEAASASFAFSMRDMYFQSQLSGTTITNLKAMEYASKQFGISSNTMASSIHGVADALAHNPGLKGYIESFGVKVQGRDISDVMMDMVKATEKYPVFQGLQIMQQLGMDADTYRLLRENIDGVIKKKQEFMEQAKAAGVDYRQIIENEKEYANMLSALANKFQLLGDKAAIAFTPVAKFIALFAGGAVDALIKLLSGKVTLNNAADVSPLGVVSNSIMDEWNDLIYGKHDINAAAAELPFTGKKPWKGKIGTAEKSTWTGSSGHMPAANEATWTGTAGTKPVRGTVPEDKHPEQHQQEYALLRSLERQYGIRTGLLKNIWGQESRYSNPNAM